MAPTDRTGRLLVLALLALPLAAEETVFDQVHGLAAEHFFDPDMAGVDWRAAGERHRRAWLAAADDAGRAAAINALIDELGASHTRYLTRADREYYELLDIFRDSLDLDTLFDGGVVTYPTVGVVTVRIDGRDFLADVVDGAAGQRAGLRVGDEVVAADGEPFQPVGSLEGKERVTFTVRSRRQGPTRDVVVPVERLEPRQVFLESIRASASEHRRGDFRVAHLRVRSYAGEHYHDVVEELLTYGGELADADALVLDLRGGWGGASPTYLSLFDRRVPRLTMVGRGEKPRSLDSQWRKPVVLVVDGGSRSGKEILAWAFRERGYGPVVGQRTAGAVLAGRPFLLTDGSLLYLAVADVRLEGRRLEGRGVEPDVPVPRPIPYATGADPQLERALDEAARLLQAAG